jgi:hypothetical protein
VFWLVLGSDSAPAFSAGFLAGYLAYDMVHYHVHHHRPRTRVGARCGSCTCAHHFQDDEAGFGVSAPYWDRVFGTRPTDGASVGPVRHAVPSVTEEHDTRLSPEDEIEVVDGFPSSPTTRGCWRAASPLRSRRGRPAALAATGFAAGAVTAAVVTPPPRAAARAQEEEGRGGGDRLEQLLPGRRPPAAPRLSQSPWADAPVDLRVEVTPPWPFRIGRGSGDGILRRRGASLLRPAARGRGAGAGGGRPDRAAARAVRGPLGEPAGAEAAIERMRFATGVDEDLRPFHERFAGDAVIGKAVRAEPAPANPPPRRRRGRRWRGRSPSS